MRKHVPKTGETPKSTNKVNITVRHPDKGVASLDRVCRGNSNTPPQIDTSSFLAGCLIIEGEIAMKSNIRRSSVDQWL